MFGRRFSSTVGLVGIDFGSTAVRMLQLRERRSGLQVVGAARVDAALDKNPPPQGRAAGGGGEGVGAVETSEQKPGDAAGRAEKLGEQIRAAFTSGGFTGRKCVISLAREDVSIQSLRLPKMPDNELRQSALWEASQRFGFDRNAMEVDFMRTGATASGSSAAGAGESREEVILIAASHAAIASRVEPVLAAGLRPVAVDTGFSALVRTFSRMARRESDRSKVRAVVDVGDSGSTVLILRGDQVAFCKPVTIGGRQFDQAVADHLQMELRAASELRRSRIASVLAEAQASGSITSDAATDRAVYEAVRPLMGELVKEVTLCLRYYGVTFRGQAPERIILTGGSAMEPRLDHMMAQACNAPIAFDDGPGTLAKLADDIQRALNRAPGPMATWAVAAGLSMRGMTVDAADHAEEGAASAGADDRVDAEAVARRAAA